MLAFDQLKEIVEGAKWLWVTGEKKAVAFLLVFFTTFVVVLYFTLNPPWVWLLKRLELTEKAPSHLLIAKKLAGYSFENAFNVVLLGGSTSRELTAHDQVVSQALSIRSGRKVHFINAGSSSQSLAISWTIADRLALKDLGMVVVGLNYYRFVENRTAFKKNIVGYHAPIPLSNSVLVDNISFLNSVPRIEPVTIGGRLFSFREFIKDFHLYPVKDDVPEKITAENLFVGPRNLYRRPVFTQEQKEKRVAEFIKSRAPQFIEAYRESFDLWDKFVRDLSSKKIKVIFIVLPFTPEMNRARLIFDPVFDPLLKKLTSSGAVVVDWRDNDNLTSEDFYDQQHLVASGRRKIFAQLIENISSHIPVGNETNNSSREESR